MPNTDTTKIPGPLYAAAGAGDLAIEGLRKVPARVAKLQDRLQTEMPGRVNGWQDRITQKVAELPSIVAELRQRVVDTDTEKLRDSARRNAATLRSNAAVAQDRAAAIYAGLVARGEQVIARTNGNHTVIAEVVAAPASDKDAAAANGEVLEGDLTGEPRKPAKKTVKKAVKTAAKKAAR
ncbi:MAG TPA: hypothetical protein VFR11_07270 [Micromonosporaceae bacterium]|jgi:hypothetical protein|nr:hypothetical protein [Micromonosporaceae bacterium]